MKIPTSHLRALLTLVLLASPMVSYAQTPERPPRGRGAGARGAAEAPPLAAGEVLSMLDAYAVVQAQDALQLREAQYGEFVGRLRQLQQARRRTMQARHAILQELRRLTSPQVAQVDEAAVRDRLRQLREHDERAAAELAKAYEAVDQSLDVRQQARFRIFEEMLERRKLDLLMRARRGAAQGRQ